ncbi:MAG: hypothetical protein RL754_1156 [Bacteroidota bacterium]|jgi:nicotinamide riboside kinase
MTEHLVFTGTESTYKTTLAQWLGERTGWTVVPEFARTYLDQRCADAETIDMHDFPLDHFEAIVGGQFQLQETHNYQTNPLKPTIFDTDTLTLAIWALDKFNQDRNELWPLNGPRRYILCAPTNEAADDRMRVDAHRRAELHEHYKKHLDALKLPYIELIEPQLENRKVELLKKLGIEY